MLIWHELTFFVFAWGHVYMGGVTWMYEYKTQFMHDEELPYYEKYDGSCH